MSLAAGIESTLAGLVRTGDRIALGDGCGGPRDTHAALSRVGARRAASMVLGWHPTPIPDLDPTSFSDVRVLMGGPGTRAAVEAGLAHTVPVRLSGVPSLLRGPLRPDLLVTTVVRGRAGLHFGTEVGYQRGLVEAGTRVVGILSHSTPCADAGPALPRDAVTVIGETDRGPDELHIPAPTQVDRDIARHVATLIPEGARIQIGPGRIADAIVAGIAVPVRIDSGLLPDPVVDLDARGLLLGLPVATYLSGTRRLYEWARDRPLLHRVERTHDLGRLSAPENGPLIALNAALEIDLDGQVNVEGIGRLATGMVGGHPDFAAAAVRGDGLSVIAMASTHRGTPTLVTRLSRPVTTPSHDVQVVVTEHGVADLRGLDRTERRSALIELWNGETADRPVGDHPAGEEHTCRERS